eukprot:gene17554-22182_t
MGRDVSEATAEKIDAEVKRLINTGYEDAKRILTENLDGLHRLARTLLDLETLSGDEIARILNGEEIVRDETTGVSLEMSSNLAVPETEPQSSTVPLVAEKAGGIGSHLLFLFGVPPMSIDFPPDENGEILRRMYEGGDTLTVPRDIDFSLLFADEMAAEAFCGIMEEEGYEADFGPWEAQGPDDENAGKWDVQITRHMLPVHAEITAF